MKVLLTGHSGFIGAHVDQHLRGRGYDILSASRSSGYDLKQKSIFSHLPDCDLVVHLAGAVGVEDSWKEPERFYRTNCLATLSVAEYVRERKIPIILLSSYMYGSPNYLPIDEAHPVSCNNPYAYSKKISEDILISYQELFGIGVRILRPMNIYGAGMPESNIVGLLLRQAIESDVIRLRDLSPKRDYLHVSDLANAISQIIDKGNIKGLGIYNLGLGKSYSVADILEQIEILIGRKFHIVETAEKRINEIHDCYADIGKFSREFNWKPKVSLNNGLQITLRQMRGLDDL